MVSRRPKTAVAVRQRLRTDSCLIVPPKCKLREQRASEMENSMTIYLSCDISNRLELFSLTPTSLYSSTEQLHYTIYTLQQAKLLERFTLTSITSKFTQTGNLTKYTMETSLVRLDLVEILPRDGDDAFEQLILNTVLSDHREEHSMKMWRYILSKFIPGYPDPDEGNHDGRSSFLSTQGAAICLTVAASDSYEDLKTAEVAAFGAADHHMRLNGIEASWILTAHGSCARLWSISNLGAMEGSAHVRPVFPRSEAHGDRASYIDFVQHAPEWQRLIGIISARPFPRLTFLAEVYRDRQPGTLVDRARAIYVTSVESDEAGELKGLGPDGELIELPNRKAWTGAFILDGPEMKKCFAARAPSAASHSRNFQNYRWISEPERQRYWSWTVPARIRN